MFPRSPIMTQQLKRTHMNSVGVMCVIMCVRIKKVMKGSSLNQEVDTACMSQSKDTLIYRWVLVYTHSMRTQAFVTFSCLLDGHTVKK